MHRFGRVKNRAELLDFQGGLLYVSYAEATNLSVSPSPELCELAGFRARHLRSNLRLLFMYIIQNVMQLPLQACTLTPVASSYETTAAQDTLHAGLPTCFQPFFQLVAPRRAAPPDVKTRATAAAPTEPEAAQ